MDKIQEYLPSMGAYGDFLTQPLRSYHHCPLPVRIVTGILAYPIFGLLSLGGILVNRSCRHWAASHNTTVCEGLIEAFRDTVLRDSPLRMDFTPNDGREKRSAYSSTEASSDLWFGSIGDSYPPPECFDEKLEELHYNVKRWAMSEQPLLQVHIHTPQGPGEDAPTRLNAADLAPAERQLREIFQECSQRGQKIYAALFSDRIDGHNEHKICLHVLTCRFSTTPSLSTLRRLPLQERCFRDSRLGDRVTHYQTDGSVPTLEIAITHTQDMAADLP